MGDKFLCPALWLSVALLLLVVDLGGNVKVHRRGKRIEILENQSAGVDRHLQPHHRSPLPYPCSASAAVTPLTMVPTSSRRSDGGVLMSASQWRRALLLPTFVQQQPQLCLAAAR